MQQLEGKIAIVTGGAAGFGEGIVRCDVASGPDVDALVQACVDTFGAPDVVVNNAGTTHKNSPLMEITEEVFDRMFAVNLKSIFHMTRAVVPLMRRQGRGVMLNVGSTAGIRPRPGLTWYNGSKGAVNLLSKSRIRCRRRRPVPGGRQRRVPDRPRSAGRRWADGLNVPFPNQAVWRQPGLLQHARLRHARLNEP